MSLSSSSLDSSHAVRPNRKSWTEEEQRAFWRKKKEEKKTRRRHARAEKTAKDQEEWDLLTEEEKERRRRDAVRVHELRRAQDEALYEQCKRQLSNPHAPRLIFDLSFAWCMSAGDTKSTIAQLKFSYSTLRRAGFPLLPMITSLCGTEEGEGGTRLNDVSTQEPLLKKLKEFEGFRKLPLPILSEHWSNVVPKASVVFLSADADEVLTDIVPDTYYVIGAFVDHNQYKGLSLHSAQRHGVRTARLPIKENMDVRNRCQILTINHVVDLLTAYATTHQGNWKSALEAVLPVRRVHQEALGSRKRRRQIHEEDVEVIDGDQST